MIASNVVIFIFGRFMVVFLLLAIFFFKDEPQCTDLSFERTVCACVCVRMFICIRMCVCVCEFVKKKHNRKSVCEERKHTKNMYDKHAHAQHNLIFH